MTASIAPVLLPNIAKIPDDVSLDAVFADLSDDNVSAPDADVEGLQAVVARAQEDGVTLRIVVVDSDPHGPEPLRDLATEVGKVEGGTVLVLSPSANGTYSDTISRVVLENAQDRTFTGNPVDSANNFVDGITEPAPRWGLVTACWCCWSRRSQGSPSSRRPAAGRERGPSPRSRHRGTASTRPEADSGSPSAFAQVELRRRHL